jgi:hypothetical protein
MRWTPEARQRQREIIQQWAPWSASTGPRTADGRARSAKNSQKHGDYSVAAKAEHRRGRLGLKAAILVLDLYEGRRQPRYANNFPGEDILAALRPILFDQDKS